MNESLHQAVFCFTIWLQLKRYLEDEIKSGYAVALSGSLVNDADIIIVPFEEKTLKPIEVFIEIYDFLKTLYPCEIKKTAVIETQHNSFNRGFVFKIAPNDVCVDVIIYAPRFRQ